MNRSYSKIRHIQEANKKLEKRMLNEDNFDVRIEDEGSMGYAILQAYADRRSSEEMKSLLKNKTNIFNRNKIINMIEDDIEAFNNNSAITDANQIGKYFFNDKNFVSSVESLLRKYEIPVHPKYY